MKYNKKTKQQIIESLEKQGKFDEDYLPQGEKYITPDSDYKFVRSNLFYKCSCKVVRTLTFLLGPLVCKILYGLKVKGKENLKGVRGAVAVCNHVEIADVLLIKQAVGHYRSYHTGAPWNNKKGLGGALLRRAGFLPLGGSIAAMKNFKTVTSQLLKQGKIISYYPEHALWEDYEKPRPLKRGAFKLAAENNVPIVPLFVTFEGKHHRAVINVLPPLHCDADLSVKENEQQLLHQCELAWQNKYQITYGNRYDTPTKISLFNHPQFNSQPTCKNLFQPINFAYIQLTTQKSASLPLGIATHFNFY